MGVTLHFSGRFSSLEDRNNIIQVTREFAERNKLEYILIGEEETSDERNPNGIVVLLHQKCDPFILKFDNNNYLNQFCKTQCANMKIHILAIDLLKEIEPYFESFTVVDEGDYWPTNEIHKLQKHFEN
jgi:hypothetical protein